MSLTAAELRERADAVEADLEAVLARLTPDEQTLAEEQTQSYRLLIVFARLSADRLEWPLLANTEER